MILFFFFFWMKPILKTGDLRESKNKRETLTTSSLRGLHLFFSCYISARRQVALGYNYIQVETIHWLPMMLIEDVRETINFKILSNM